MVNKKRLGLIGGTGYLGSAFRKFYHQDFEIIVNFGRHKEAEMRSNELYYDISSSTTSDLAEIMKQNQLTTVIDFAYSSVPKTSFEHPIADFSENLTLVNKHLESVKMVPGLCYVYVSSGGTVYGEGANTPIEEDQQNFPLSPYGITKMASERYVNMYHHLFDIPVKILRPSNIYGPGQVPFKGQGFIPTALASMYTSKPLTVFGTGSHIRDYLFIEDFCAALHDVLLFGTFGSIYNVGSSEGYAINEILQLIQNASGIDSEDLKITYLPDRRFDVKYNVLDCKKLNALAGWNRKVDIHEGIDRTAVWIKNYLSKNLS